MPGPDRHARPTRDQRVPGGSAVARRIRPGVEVARALVREWREDRVPDLAAEIAFYAIVSLVPGMLALAAALGTIEPLAGPATAERVEDALIRGLSDIFGGEASPVITAVRELFRRPSTGLLTFGVLSAVWALSRGFAALIRALDVVYDLDERRSWVAVRATALGLALGSVVVAAVTLAMIVVGPLLGRGQQVAEALGLGDVFATLWDLARIPLAAVVLVTWAATVFHIAPNHHTPWRWDLPGAVLTAVLWAAVSRGLRLYLALAGGANDVVGVLGGTLVVLLWLYLMGLAVLVGGELNAVLAQRWGPPPEVESRRWLAPAGARARAAFARLRRPRTPPVP